MTTDIPFGTRLIGQTEKTLNAILDRLLAGSGVTEPQWVALNVTLHGGSASPTEAAQRIATTLKTSPVAGAEVLAGLIDHGFVETGAAEEIGATNAGREFHDTVQQRITEITSRLWGDIPADSRETAAAVLNTTLLRATAELDSLNR